MLQEPASPHIRPLAAIHVSGVSISGVSLVTIELFFRFRSCVFTWLVRHSKRPLENALRSLVSRRLPDMKSSRILNSCLNFSCAHTTQFIRIVLRNPMRVTGRDVTLDFISEGNPIDEWPFLVVAASHHISSETNICYGLILKGSPDQCCSVWPVEPLRTHTDFN